MRHSMIWLALSGALLVGCGSDDEPADSEPADPCNLPVSDVPTPDIYTPRWAFEPWISKDISDAADTYEFVEGFKSRDIPVGVVVIDSPWETHYNTFVPNPDRYPNFDTLVSDMHDQDVRVVMWVTQMVNYSGRDYEEGGDTYEGPSPNFEEGERCGFFVDEGRTYPWWKGDGAGVDFFNPKAVAWWHAQQDPLYAMGIDGWKLDFGEQYLRVIGDEPLDTAAGPKSLQEYSEEYYRDFYAYGVQQRGREDFTTMVRPYDQSYGFEGRFYARPEHAPVGWVGDNHRNWEGLADALDHIFRSARAGYAMLGSDIGGYLDRDENNPAITIPFDQDNLVRWTAIGAMNPFMELHGRANLEPWNVPERPDETVEIYRYWATLHHEMVPYWYSVTLEAYAGGPMPLRPIGDEASWPGDYRYEVGDAFLVAPILDETGVRDVALPAGGRWVDWWQMDQPALDGGQTLSAYDATDRNIVPMFLKEGAIVPMEVEGSLTGMGSAASAGHLTVLVFPGAQATRFVLHDADGETTTIDTETGRVGLSRATTPVLLRVRTETGPSSVSLNGAGLAEAADAAALEQSDLGWRYDAATRTTIVKLPASEQASELSLQ